MWSSLGHTIWILVLRDYLIALRGILRLGCWNLLPHVLKISFNWVLVLTRLRSWWNSWVVMVYCLSIWSCHYISVRSTIWIVFLAIISSELILVLKERVLMALRASRPIWNVASNMCTTCTLAFPRRIDLEKFLASLVHVWGSWILVREVAAVCHRVCEWIFVPDWASSFLVLRFHRFCSWMIPLS